MPASSIARSIICPAGPTNGRPIVSSWSPGCSPTNITAASGGPSPNTVCVAGSNSGQRRQVEASRRARSQFRHRPRSAARRGPAPAGRAGEGASSSASASGTETSGVACLQQRARWLLPPGLQRLVVRGVAQAGAEQQRRAVPVRSAVRGHDRPTPGPGTAAPSAARWPAARNAPVRTSPGTVSRRPPGPAGSASACACGAHPPAPPAPCAGPGRDRDRSASSSSFSPALARQTRL